MGDAGKNDKTVVMIDPKPAKGLVSSAIDIVEKLVIKFMFDNSQKPYYISGNFAPVSETPPECMNGEFIRVGPNSKFAPIAGYHLFDGDGMIHGMRIKDGKATYLNRYVKTSRLKQEEFFDQAKISKIGNQKGLYALLTTLIQFLRIKTKVLDNTYGLGTANTALVYHDGNLLALNEVDKPYVIKVLEDGDLQTVGLLNYDKRLKHSFTAHPKVDPYTGEMFGFGYAFEPPYITYRIISKDGVMFDPVPIVVPEPIVMHDFGITENYAIFMDLPLYLKPKEMLKKNTRPFIFDRTKKSRFGILPRYAKDDLQIRWFELPNCYIVHTANAWEEEDEVVFIVSRLSSLDLDLYSRHVQEKADDLTNELYISDEIQYENWFGIVLDNNAKVTAVAKFDLHCEPEMGKKKIEVGGNVVGVIELGPNRYGSEAIFVPRESSMTSSEDDGYLIFFVHDENSGKSYGHVMDARTMSADPVAVVELPRRVPYGFHAYFVSEVNTQDPWKPKVEPDPLHPIKATWTGIELRQDDIIYSRD